MQQLLYAAGKRVMLRKDMRALLKFTMHHFTVLPAIAVFLAAAAIILTGFFGYNAWNISCGMTGNDRFKVSEYNREVALEVWLMLLPSCCCCFHKPEQGS